MTTQATNKHPLAEILYAIADGKEVQQRILSCGTPEWKKLDYHSAFSLGLPNVEYRIKPKEKVKKWKWVFEEDGIMDITANHYSDSDEFYECFPSEVNLVQKIYSTEQEFDK